MNIRQVDSMSIMQGWHDNPVEALSRCAQGTMFLICGGRMRGTHVCYLGNWIPGDKSRMAVRMSDHRVIRIERLRTGTRVFILP